MQLSVRTNRRKNYDQRSELIQQTHYKHIQKLKVAIVSYICTD